MLGCPKYDLNCCLCSAALNWSVRMMSDLETYIVSVERIREYAELENEAAWEVEEKKPASDWPQQGEVTFKHYSTRLNLYPAIINDLALPE